MNHKVLEVVVLALVLVGGWAGAVAADPDTRAVLVTGASSGIGLRIAETLADSGFHVYAGARKRADMERLDAMENVSAIRLDVTEPEDIDAAVAFVTREGRGLWGVVNNAGVLRLSSLGSGDVIDDVRFTFDVNVFGPIRINSAFLPLLKDSGGRITTIGSVNGFLAIGGDGGYSASKFAMEGYTDSLVAELATSGVHVSIVEPGAYKSEIRGKALERILAAADAGEIELDDAQRREMQRTELGNTSLDEPDAVARAVLHAMSSDQPQRRYLVTPDEETAHRTVNAAAQRLLELNGGQPHSLDRDELHALLNELLDDLGEGLRDERAGAADRRR